MQAALRQQFRERKLGILYDDAYGLWTEEDQASAAAEAFALMDPEGPRAASGLLFWQIKSLSDIREA